MSIDFNIKNFDFSEWNTSNINNIDTYTKKKLNPVLDKIDVEWDKFISTELGADVASVTYSVGMGATEAVNKIFDAAMYVAGGVHSAGVAIYDTINCLGSLDEMQDTLDVDTKTLFTKVIFPGIQDEIKTLWSDTYMPIISWNVKDTLQNEIYSTDDFANIYFNSHESVKAGSFFDELTQKVTEYAIQMTLGAATGGTSSIPKATSMWMGIISLGSNLEKEFNELKKDVGDFSNSSWKQLNEAIGYSNIKAGIDAGIWYIAGQVKTFLGAASNATKVGAIFNKLPNALKILKNPDFSSISIKCLKPTLNAITDKIVKNKNTDFDDWFVDTLAIGVSEWSAVGFSKVLQKISGAKTVTGMFDKTKTKIKDSVLSKLNVLDDNIQGLSDDVVEAMSEVKQAVQAASALDVGFDKGIEKTVKELAKEGVSAIENLVNNGVELLSDVI